jgi:hypothetical protein
VPTLRGPVEVFDSRTLATTQIRKPGAATPGLVAIAADGAACGLPPSPAGP